MNFRLQKGKKSIQIATLLLILNFATGPSLTQFSNAPAKRTLIPAYLADDVHVASYSAQGSGADYIRQLPLSFEENKGQAAASVNYISRGLDYSVLIQADGAKFRLRSGERATEIGMKVVGANSQAKMFAQQKQPLTINYLQGSDPQQWRTNISTYARVVSENLYPGVDLVYYGNQRQLEYDFNLTAGVDYKTIKLAFDGADAITVDDQGNLVLHTASGNLRHHKPVAYQVVNGSRLEVVSRYNLLGENQVGFTLGEYDATQPLVIDPVLEYSTYYGGTSFDVARDMYVDAAGNSYVVGDSTSTDFLNNAGQNNSDIFVAKFVPDGSYVSFIYFGGNANDYGTGVAIDGSGNMYVGGITESANFPRVGLPNQMLKGASDAFVTKLNAQGTAYLYSTLIGGTGNEGAVSIALTATQNVVVTGRTSSTDLTTVNAIQPLYGGGTSDAFVAKLAVNGMSFVYASYLGGSGNENLGDASGIAVDATGIAYITGDTSSINFPRKNALQNTKSGNAASRDAFITKLNADGSDFVYSTYLGGNSQDAGLDIAADAAGNAFVSGITGSKSFPNINSVRPASDGFDAFVTKLNANGSAVSFFTFLGGRYDDSGNSLAVDGTGNIYVAGSGSEDYPDMEAIQLGYAGGDVDAFVTKLNSTGTVVFSTCLGGGNTDVANGVGLGGDGIVFITGVTSSTNFKTVKTSRTTNIGQSDLFFSKIDLNATPTGPIVFSAQVVGKKLIVTGQNFHIGAELYVNGLKQKKTFNDEANPTNILIGNKSGVQIPSGQTVTILVKNTDGVFSNSISYTKP